MWVECYDAVHNLDRVDYLRVVENGGGKYQIGIAGTSAIVVSDPVEWDTDAEAHAAMVKFVHAVGA